MVITPNSTFKLLRGVPLDMTHKNTIYFGDTTTQENYFSVKSKYTFNACTYVREQKKIRVERKADDIYECNYLMYKNTSYGSKWFYAFITDVEWINNETSYVTFVIDDMQTWLPSVDYTIKPSFVEREHVLIDDIGLHLVDENLACGEYVVANVDEFYAGKFMAVIIGVTTTAIGDPVRGGSYGNVYSGLAYYAFHSTATSEINNFITTYNSRSDAINTIFTVPESSIPAFTDGDKLADFTRTVHTQALPIVTDIDMYNPKNNKLFTYPYNFISVNNTDGGSLNYRYEYFSSLPEFEIRGTITGSPQLQIFPTNYKGLAENLEEALILGSYPQCSWTTDYYKNWLAQRSFSSGVGVASSLVGTAVGAATGNPIAIASGIIGVASSLGDFYQASVTPNQLHGSSQSDVNLAYGDKTFKFYQKTIRHEFAKILDNYFDMFGYKVNEVKVPNLSTRPSWNYVKTNDVTLIGNTPADALKRISDAFNKGITFWKSGGIVGDYTLNNRVV